MEKTAIQWNIVNWITITLMAGIGTAAFAAAANLVRKRSAPAADDGGE